MNPIAGEEKIKGGCMCGAVRYEASGEPVDVAYCHCESCRKHSGAPAVVWVAFDTNQIRFVGEARKIFESSPGVERAFCGQCGTPLTWEAKSLRFPGRHITEFFISTLDTPEKFVPDRHWFAGEQLSWFEVADDLPRYQEIDIGVEPTHTGPKKS